MHQYSGNKEKSKFKARPQGDVLDADAGFGAEDF